MQHTYIAIDLKSFYASVECIARNLDPLTTNLVVADLSKANLSEDMQKVIEDNIANGTTSNWYQVNEIDSIHSTYKSQR